LPLLWQRVSFSWRQARTYGNTERVRFRAAKDTFPLFRTRGRRLHLLVLAAVLLCFLSSGARAEWFLERPLDDGFSAFFLSTNNTDCIVADEAGNVHVIWIAESPWDTRILYRRFGPAGWGGIEYVDVCGGPTGWSESERVGARDVGDPDLALDGAGNAHVVWFRPDASVSEGEHSEIYYRDFEYEYCEELAWAWDAASNPCIAAGSGGRVDVIWRDRPYANHYALMHLAIPSYEYNSVLAAIDSVGKASLAAGVDGDLHLVWGDHRDGNWELYYSKRDEMGWGTGERLTETAGASLEQHIATGEDGYVHVVWVEGDGVDSEVLHMAYDGTAWGPPDSVSRSPGSARSPRLAVDHEGRAHAVWVDDRDGSPQVYYSVRSGASWSEAARVTDSEGEAANPGVAVDTTGVVHVVWQDDRSGKNRVYWRALYPGAMPSPEIESVEPGSAFSGDVIEAFRISGHGFVAPASAWMAKRGEPSVPLTGLRVASPREIICSVDLLRVHHGDWNIVVENPNGSRDTLRAGFQITPFARPLALSMDTDSLESNLGLYVRSLVGGNFVSPISVWFDRGGCERRVAVDTKVRSPDTLAFTMNLGGASPGIWNVVVENPDGRRDTLPAGFEVLPGRWSEDVRLTNDPGGSMTGYSHSRTVAVDTQGRVYVVWYDDRSGHYEIYYKVLDRSGWGPDMELTSDGEVSAHPAVATGPDGSVHVVWHDRRDGPYSVIYYEENTGSGWGPDQRISTSDVEATKPAIAVDGNGDVHVVWCEAHKGWQVMYRKRATGVWEDEVPLTEAPGSHAFASVAVDDIGVVHVVWQGRFGESDGASQIY
jgi:hypothetical protein